LFGAIVFFCFFFRFLLSLVAALVLTYCPAQDNGQGFTDASLQITRFQEPPFTWTPTSFNYGNLLGMLDRWIRQLLFLTFTFFSSAIFIIELFFPYSQVLFARLKATTQPAPTTSTAVNR
jgi:hypothetical protein